LLITIECYLNIKIKEEDVCGARVTYGKVRNSSKFYLENLTEESVNNFEVNLKIYRIMCVVCCEKQQ
jgi:hypothetical protein